MEPGKRALVTGASSGIGRATAERLLEEGWSLVAVARRPGPLAELEAAAPGRAFALPLDLRDPAASARAQDEATARLGGLDLLVNAAGVCWPGSAPDVSDEAMDEMIDVNLRAPMRLCRALAPALAASRGQIINVSSIAGHLPFEFMATYCATKAGLSMYGRVLARELRAHGVRVNTVSPDGTDTELFDKMGVTIDRATLIPVRDMAEMIVTLTRLPPSVDVGDWVLEQRLVPKL